MPKVIIATVDAYPPHRYGRPWAALAEAGRRNQFIFNAYEPENGSEGNAGRLVIPDPETGKVYACGQKDQDSPRPSPTFHLLWDGEHFIPSTRQGELLSDKEAQETLAKAVHVHPFTEPQTAGE